MTTQSPMDINAPDSFDSLESQFTQTLPSTSSSSSSSLRPRASRSPSPSSAHAFDSTPDSGTLTPQDSEYYHVDDNSGIEWFGFPKARAYDVFKVPRQQSPSSRDSAELPLIATRASDHHRVVLWAKLDTGADVNVINRTTLSRLLGNDDAALRSRLRPISHADLCTFNLVGNNRFDAEHYVVLDFRAGRAGREFRGVRFIVIQDDGWEADCDGVPNVVLGHNFLRDNSMIMIDLEYHCDAEDGLEVIAPRAEDEARQVRCLLPYVLPKVPGVVRGSSTGRPGR